MSIDNKKLKTCPIITDTSVTDKGEIRVQWTEVEGAEKYAVKRAERYNEEPVLLGWSKSGEYIDKTAKPNITYWYRIYAVKPFKNKKSSKKVSPVVAKVISDMPAAEGVSAVSKGDRLYGYAQAILTGSLEGDAVGHAHDEVATLGEEVDVEFFVLGSLGAFDAATLVDVHLRIGIVALLLGSLVYGEDAGEAAMSVEVEHGAGVGSHFVVSAGVAQHTALGIGLLDRGIYQGQRAVAAAIDHLELLLTQYHSRRREQLYVEHLAIGHGTLGSLRHMGAKPYGLSLEVGGVVKVKVDLLLRTQAVEVVDMGTLHEDGFRLFL